MKAVDCRGLYKAFKTNEILSNITLSIDENKIVGLVGRNGVGKTTLLKIIAGYLLPTAGEVSVLGETSFNNLKVLSKLVFVNDQMPYDKFMKLYDIMQLYQNLYENWSQTVADQLLKEFNLSKNMKYSNLSTGMKMQFNSIVGLSTRAQLTIFDEPTMGLDVAMRKKLYELMLNEYMTFPRTIVLSSHLLSEIENLLEEVVFLNQGKVQLHKSVEDLHAYAAYLYGKADTVYDFIKNKNTIHIENYGGSVKAVIENDLIDKEISYLTENGITINRVPIEEVFAYLTDNQERGDYHDSKSSK